ncbi:glycosyltransferase [Vibrio fluvialis]|uniref:glycosyltransferase n=1 Tax=Vibrio fluvialis TaxID=676 RepID=UPI001F20BF39|nr:glycosyltransferase [Vibrio fluvialis]MCE7639645.1 glycosyltransferase [Vibrio fluvialis]UPO64710.1 glycosyl transferase [Vibrio fluvialis]
MVFNFFTNVPSIHLSPIIKYLSKNNLVNVYYDKDISEHRKKSGWDFPDFGNANVNKLISFDIENAKGCSVYNFYSGMGAYKNIHDVFKRSISIGVENNFIIQESVTYNNVNYFFKLLKYISFRVRFGKSIKAVFTCGGAKFLRSCGFNNVHDFAYYTNETPCVEDTIPHKNKYLRLVYIGEISKLKRIAQFVQELSKSSSVSLDIYGAERDVRLSDLKRHFSNKISFHGAVDNNKLKTVLGQYDYLVLPSYKEGWGVVVNEAISAGVGVIASEVVGSKAYIETHCISNDIHFISFDDMQQVVSFIKTLKPLTIESRTQLLKDSDCLRPVQGASIILETIRR